MLASPAALVLVAHAVAHLPDGRTLRVLAHVPATPDHPELYELGSRLCADGAWELLEVEADGVELELVGVWS